MIDHLVPQAIERRDDLLVVNDGARKKVREKCHEEKVVEQVFLFGSVFPGIHEVGDLGKGIKADSQRNGNVKQREVNSSQGICGVDKEVHILEISQEGKISTDGNEKGSAAKSRGLLLFQEDSPSKVIEKDASCDKRDVDRVPPTIVEKGSEDKPDLGR
jgi:hypothetical protein